MRTASTHCARLLQEPGRQVVLQPAHAAVRVVHPRAGRRLHEVLHHLALDERVEDRRHRPQLQRERAREHQVVQDAVPLREHRADPLRAIRDLDAGQALHGDRPPELVVERADPVVTVHQDQDLARVAVLGELLGRAVHVADHRLGAGDDLAVQLQDHPEHAVGRRVLRPDVEDHLLGGEVAGGGDLDVEAAAADHGGDLRGPERGAIGGVDHRAPILRGAPAPAHPGSPIGCGHVRHRHPAQGPVGRRAPAHRAGQTRRRFARALVGQAEPRANPRRGARGGGQGRGPAAGGRRVLATALGRASAVASGLTRVVNATGVILHTGLGRAPLSKAAARAAGRAARSYTDLEVDRVTGARGRRTTRAEAMLTALTGAEAALVVNNCAAALLLSLAALAKRKEVRGVARPADRDRRRVPDPRHPGRLRRETRGGRHHQPHADRRLSRRRLRADRRHPEGPSLELPGGGIHGRRPARRTWPRSPTSTTSRSSTTSARALLAHGHDMPPDEPAVSDALAEGADLVTFSGDKLLGGPQAGVVVGNAALIDKLRRNPDRARRARGQDAGRGARGRAGRACSPARRRPRPARCIACCREPAEPVHVARAEPRRARSTATLRAPTCTGASPSVGRRRHARGRHFRRGASASPSPMPPVFAARLRTGRPSVFCRVEADHVLVRRAHRPGGRCPPSRPRDPLRAGGRRLHRGLSVAGDLRVIATAGHVDHGKSVAHRARSPASTRTASKRRSAAASRSTSGTPGARFPPVARWGSSTSRATNASSGTCWRAWDRCAWSCSWWRPTRGGSLSPRSTWRSSTCWG